MAVVDLCMKFPLKSDCTVLKMKDFTLPNIHPAVSHPNICESLGLNEISFKWSYHRRSLMHVQFFFSHNVSFPFLCSPKNSASGMRLWESTVSWWRGVVGSAFQLKRSYSTPGLVSTAMSDCLRAGKPSRCEACQLGRLSLPTLRGMVKWVVTHSYGLRRWGTLYSLSLIHIWRCRRRG